MKGHACGERQSERSEDLTGPLCLLRGSSQHYSTNFLRECDRQSGNSCCHKLVRAAGCYLEGMTTSEELACSHQAFPIVEAPHAQIMILSIFIADCAYHLRSIVVARIQQSIVREFRKDSGQRIVHVIRIASRQIDTPAPANKQGISGDQSRTNHEALTAGSMTRRMKKPYPHVTYEDFVAATVFFDVAIGETCHLFYALRLSGIDVNLQRYARDQVRKPAYVMAKNIPADVIGMIMGDQRPDELHIIPLGGRYDARDIPSRIDDHADSLDIVTNEINEIRHLRSEIVGQAKISACKKLFYINPHNDPVN